MGRCKWKGIEVMRGGEEGGAVMVIGKIKRYFTIAIVKD